MTDLRAPYLEALDRMLALVDGLSDDLYNHRPGAGAWSAGECVVHLNKTAKGYLPNLEAAASADGPRASGPFRYGWASRKFVDMLRPGSRPIPTFGPMKPPAVDGERSAIDKDRSIARFLADIDRFLRVIDQAEGLDLAVIKVRSPFASIVRLPLGAFLEALGVHCLRHVAQAERAVAAARA